MITPEAPLFDRRDCAELGRPVTTAGAGGRRAPARVYGRSEQVIGQLVEELGNRPDLFLATKTPIGGDVSDAEATLAVSFRDLRSDVTDLMQIHNLSGTPFCDGGCLTPFFRSSDAPACAHFVGRRPTV